jgi:hypothetical protein
MVHPAPGITGIKYIEVDEIFCFGEPEQGFYGVQGGTRLPPEIQGHEVGHIAAEAVYVAFPDPKIHGGDHGLAHGLIVIIEVYYIIPAMGIIELAIDVLFIIFRMGIGPNMVETGMVGHPINNDLHAGSMGLLYQVFEIAHGAKFGIGTGIVGTGIIATHGAFAASLANGCNGHEPEYFYAHIGQPGEVVCKGCKCSFRSILTDVDLINIGIGAPSYRCKASQHKIIMGWKRYEYIGSAGIWRIRRQLCTFGGMKTFNVPIIYRSPLINAIKNKRKAGDKMKKDLTPTFLDLGALQIYLARHFGFCYGVENAIEISFRTIEENPGKRIFLLSEMIHNPQVNADLLSRGVQFLQDTYGKQLIAFEELKPDDVVIIPAFGTTLEIEAKLTSLGIPTEKYNTTCPFVEKVWNRSEQIAKKG